jgi:hemerythrin-like domain-containing protein
MKPTEILISEHDLIRRALGNFSLAIEKLEQGERPPKEFFGKAIDFTRTFSDKFHHFKEEYLMFGRLAEKRKGPFSLKNGAIDAQIDALRYQHDRGRNLIGEVANSLEGYAKGEDAQTMILLENFAGYLSLLRHHIHKEEHVFYPMVDKELSEVEQESLIEEFKKEERKLGDTVIEDSRKLVMEMGALL